MNCKNVSKKRLLKRGKRCVLAAVVLTACMCLFLSVTVAQAAYDSEIGYTDIGTRYYIYYPTTWNGTLILDLDGDRWSSRYEPLLNWVTEHGYAVGGIHRSDVNDFKTAVDEMVEVRRIFSENVGTPDRTIAWGRSRGAFAARHAMEFEPDIFDGALVFGGGGAGQLAVLLRTLDSQFVLKTLVNPNSPLEIVNVADSVAEKGYLTDLVTLADSSALGRARLALAAAVEQFDPWTMPGTEEPASTDYDAQYQQLVELDGRGSPNYVSINSAVRASVEELARGNVSWNHGVNYKKMLARSGRKDFVLAMYKKAGASLNDDLKTLARAPRISADQDAVNFVEKITSYTGEIEGPVMNVDNDNDPVDPGPCKMAYERTVRRAGNQKQLRIAFVHAPGHGGYNYLEQITGFVALIDRLDRGKWGSTSPEAMNALAAEIAAEIAAKYPDLLEDIPSTSRFIEHRPKMLLRPWDVSDWDSYVPEYE